jgi:hypothetical protein
MLSSQKKEHVVNTEIMMEDEDDRQEDHNEEETDDRQEDHNEEETDIGDDGKNVKPFRMLPMLLCIECNTKYNTVLSFKYHFYQRHATPKMFLCKFGCGIRKETPHELWKHYKTSVCAGTQIIELDDIVPSGDSEEDLNNVKKLENYMNLSYTPLPCMIPEHSIPMDLFKRDPSFYSRIWVHGKNGCWIYGADSEKRAILVKDKYTSFCYEKNKFRPCHVHSYIIAHGEENHKPHLVVDHMCRTKRCCNPKHLQQIPNGGPNGNIALEAKRKREEDGKIVTKEWKRRNDVADKLRNIMCKFNDLSDDKKTIAHLETLDPLCVAKIEYCKVTTCWIWNGTRRKSEGYLEYFPIIDGKRRRMSPRPYIYKILVGECTTDSHGMSEASCGNKFCVSPHHLSWGAKNNVAAERALAERPVNDPTRVPEFAWNIDNVLFSNVFILPNNLDELEEPWRSKMREKFPLFEKTVAMCNKPNAFDKCWIAGGSNGKWGYTQIWDRVLRRTRSAHLVVWHRLRSSVHELQDWEQLDHKCKLTMCCNPDHVKPVTIVENSNQPRNGAYTKALQTTTKKVKI